MPPSDPSLGSAAGGWDLFQVTYWNSIASQYDSFYESRWSGWENKVVRRRVADVVGPDLPGTVLDIGCGRGLGFELLQRSGPPAHYAGVDVSFEMLARTSAPKGQVVQQAMDKLGIADGSVAAVVALFSSGSYAEDVAALLAETARVLRPGGVAYLSFLSRWGLSRARGIIGTSAYRTRGDQRPWAAAPAHRVRRRQVAELAEQAGLAVTGTAGVNAFSGLVETPRLWKAGRAVAKAVPALSHTLEFTVCKP